MTESDQGAQAARGGPSRRGTETVEKSAASSSAGPTGGSTGGAARRTSGESGASGTARPAPAPTSAPTSTERGPVVPSKAGSTARKPRRARLRLTQVDAWTVMKTSFLLSIALGIVSVVAVAVVWTVLGVAGVFDSMNDTVQTLLGNDFRIQDYIGTGRILGFTMILAVVDVVLLTAIATLAAFLYNLSATLLGGVEVTLTEDA